MLTGGAEQTDFPRRAAIYDRSAATQRRIAEWLAEWIEPAIPSHAGLWELGAGTGFFTRELAARGYHVLATDIAPEMVAHGRRICPAADWAIHDGKRMPKNACDRLFSSSLLQWMKNPRGVLRVFYDALRPGGRMLHGFFVEPSLCELGHFSDAGTLALFRRTEAEWLEAFRAAGFEILRSEARTERETFPSALVFLRNLHGVGPLAERRRVSVSALRRFLREYEEKFACDGGVFATWRMLRVEAARP